MIGPLSFKLRVLAKQVPQDFMHSFLGLIAPGNLPVPAQDCTHLCDCFRFKSGRESKAAKRLGGFLRQNEVSGYVKAEG